VFQLQESFSATGKCSSYRKVFQLQGSFPATMKCSSYREVFYLWEGFQLQGRVSTSRKAVGKCSSYSKCSSHWKSSRYTEVFQLHGSAPAKEKFSSKESVPATGKGSVLPVGKCSNTEIFQV
jgi:hypothetical protein